MRSVEDPALLRAVVLGSAEVAAAKVALTQRLRLAFDAETILGDGDA